MFSNIHVRILATFSFISVFLCAPQAFAQQVRDHGTRSHGRIGDSMGLLEARDIVERGGVPCAVTVARLIGRDDEGARQYEVVCREGPGYLLIDDGAVVAHDCLALSGQGDRAGRPNAACRLPGNRNPIGRLAALAEAAGVDCRVDQGAMLGLAEDGAALYEIGCRGAVGAWIQQTASGWSITDCLAVVARGQTCSFTSPEEEAAGLAVWLADSPARDCQPTQVRSMGSNAAGLDYYEITCEARDPVVVSRDAAGHVVRILECREAHHLGDGCSRSVP